MEAVPNIKDRLAALSITMLIFASLILFLFYYLIITPLPVYPVEPEIIVDISFGGGGGEMGVEGMGTPDNATAAQTTPTTPGSNEDVFTANVADPDLTIKETKKVTNDKNVVKKEVEKEPQPSQELLDFMKSVNKKLTKSSGESNNPTGTGSGDRGTGLGEGDNKDGRGGKGDNDKGTHGTGIYQLSGRKLLKRPELLDESQEEGIVVVEIVVDETGKVVDAIPGQRGSTTTSAYLYTLARQAAKTAKFSPSPDGITEQHGTITIVFKLQ